MAPDQTWTLTLSSRRQTITMGIAFVVVAAVIAVAAIAWVAEHASNKLVFVVIPLAVVAVFLLVELATRIMRLRVIVTPTTITTYNRSASRVTPSIFGGRTVHSVPTAQVAAVMVREYGGIGSIRVVPSVVCHDGSEFTLDPLTAESERKTLRQHQELELLRDLTGVRVDGVGPVAGVTGQSGIMPPPLPRTPAFATAAAVATAAAGTSQGDPDYPPPSGPPANYDPARWDGVPVPASPSLPADGATAGWRHDPVSVGHYRYFDGSRWTEWVYNGMAVSARHLG